MRILAIDQARKGAWSVFDYNSRTLIGCGTFEYASRNHTFAKAMVEIGDLMLALIDRYEIGAVYLEDIQLRRNVDTFKRLARLQGSLCSLLERSGLLYDYVNPSKWQSFCNARGRTTKEISSKMTEASTESGKKKSKLLAIQFVRENYGIETEDDNLADAICIGHYVVYTPEINLEELKEN